MLFNFLNVKPLNCCFKNEIGGNVHGVVHSVVVITISYKI